MGLYLATLADPMRFCGRTPCNVLRFRELVGLDMMGDLMTDSVTP
jgi:hypothetical protein